MYTMIITALATMVNTLMFTGFSRRNKTEKRKMKTIAVVFVMVYLTKSAQHNIQYALVLGRYTKKPTDIGYF